MKRLRERTICDLQGGRVTAGLCHPLNRLNELT